MKPIRQLISWQPRVAAAALLVGGLTLAACGHGDARLPEQAMTRGDGRPVETLALAEWPAQGRPQAVILALHGFGDAGSLTFAGAARSWSARGIAVYAPDQRGFGANPSRRDWPGAEALVSDAVALSRRLRTQHPDTPLIVLGHSMGGGVALAATARGLEADGLVLAGPAIAGGAALNPLLRAGGLTLSLVVPDRRWTGDGLVDIRPSDNVEAMIRVAGDPRHFADPSSRELYGLIRIMDRAAAAAPGVPVPVLTLMGANDDLLRPAQVRRVHDRIPDGRFVLYRDGWHWLFRDLQAERVWTDVADFALALGDG